MGIQIKWSQDKLSEDRNYKILKTKGKNSEYIKHTTCKFGKVYTSQVIESFYI